MNQNEPQQRPSYMSAADLLARAKRERADLAALWHGLTEAQMIQRPGPQADWSVKDLIAHITWWEAAMLDLVSRAIAGKSIAIDGTVDEANAISFEQKRDLPLPTILSDFESSVVQIESLLRQLGNEQIHDTQTAQIFGKPLHDFIVANTFAHYAEHNADLRAYRKGIRN